MKDEIGFWSKIIKKILVKETSISNSLRLLSGMGDEETFLYDSVVSMEMHLCRACILLLSGRNKS